MQLIEKENTIDYTITYCDGLFKVLAINQNGAVRGEGKTRQGALNMARRELKKLEIELEMEDAHLE